MKARGVTAMEMMADFAPGEAEETARKVKASSVGAANSAYASRIMPCFYEFFAGGGMARAGLGANWRCVLANDIDQKKAASYIANWGEEGMRIQDVGTLTAADALEVADLAWASFPCQDLSLAGDYLGLKGKRSGTFWLFWRLMRTLVEEQRAPSLIVLENVCGALTSHEGRDFAAIGAALSDAGYRWGSLVINASRFVPQSRPRLFIVAAQERIAIPLALTATEPNPLWHPANLVNAFARLSEPLAAKWVWWSMPAPPRREAKFADILEDDPPTVEWYSATATQRLLGMMSPLNQRKVEQAKRMGTRMVGGIYKRTRRDEYGIRAQRAEIRFDDVAGCLRTPAGGSSRQSIMLVEGDKIRCRLLSPREAARLMGLPESYKLPDNYNEAYHLAGDGVVVPAVRFLAAHLLEPLLLARVEPGKAA